MNRKSILFYKIGCWILFVFSAAHLLGHFQAATNQFTDDRGKLLWNLLNNYKRDFMGVSRSTADFLNGFSLLLFFTTLYLGIQNLVVLKHNSKNLKFMKVYTLLNVLFFFVAVLLSIFYFIYPPLILFALIFLMYLISLLLTGKEST